MSPKPRRKNLELLDELLDVSGKHVLDVGCGDGALVRHLARRGAHAMGAEVQTERIREAEAHDPIADEAYMLASGEALPLPDESHDVVIYFNALHHLPEARMAEALIEAARVLKPNGVLYVAEPLAQGPFFELMRPIEDETRVRRAAYERLCEAARVGAAFEMEREITYEAALLFPDFAAFRARVEAVDPKRRARVQAQERSLAEAFDRSGERGPEGWIFHQPMRVNLLRRRP